MKAFITGHRDINHHWKSQIRDLLRLGLQQGATEFLVGMALGTDQVAAELLSQTNLKWTAVIPCADQDALWKPRERSHYRKLLEKATKVIELYPKYAPGVMQARNLYMVRHSELCLAVWNGRDSGGTYLTVKMAIAHNLPIIRFNPSAPKDQQYTRILPKYKQLSLFDLTP